VFVKLNTPETLTQCCSEKGDCLSQSSSLPTKKGGTGCGSFNSSELRPASLKNESQVIGPVTLIAFGSHKLKIELALDDTKRHAYQDHRTKAELHVRSIVPGGALLLDSVL